MGKATFRRVFVASVIGLVAIFASACNAANPVSNLPSGAETVATFDGGKVTEGELQESIELLSQQTGQPAPEPGTEEYEAIVPQVLPQVVQTEIAEAYAEENDITVTDQDVNEEIETLKGQLADQAQAAGQDLGPDEAFDQALQQAGISENQLRDDIRQSLPVQKVQEEVVGDVEPTQGEIEDYYEQNREAQFTTPAQRCAAHILYGPDQEQQAEETYQTLQDNPDRFADIAREDSQDTGSAENGGDLGCLGQGETVPNFDEALFDAEEGDLIGPVETQFGYHIIRLDEIREESVQPLSEVEDQIREQLTTEQQGQAFSEWLANQEEERNVEYLPQYDPNQGEETTQTGE